MTKPTDLAASERHLYNDATNEIANRVDVLHQQLNLVASPEQRDVLTAIAARLRALGKDPNDPVPTVVDPRDRYHTGSAPGPQRVVDPVPLPAGIE